MVERRGTYRVWVERSEVKKSLERLRHGREGIIKTDFREVELKAVD
jgi:hypothetical protein